MNSKAHLEISMYVIDSLIAEETLVDVSELSGKTALTAAPTGDIAVGARFTVAADIADFLTVGSYQYIGGPLGSVSSYVAEADYNVYTSYFLGFEPYVVSSLGGGNVEFKMTGFEATKDDPLGQRATFGYKMWTGAKVIDPVAIVKIQSRSAFDLLTGVSLTDSYDWEDTADQA